MAKFWHWLLGYYEDELTESLPDDNWDYIGQFCFVAVLLDLAKACQGLGVVMKATVWQVMFSQQLFIHFSFKLCNCMMVACVNSHAQVKFVKFASFSFTAQLWSLCFLVLLHTGNFQFHWVVYFEWLCLHSRSPLSERWNWTCFLDTFSSIHVQTLHGGYLYKASHEVNAVSSLSVLWGRTILMAVSCHILKI